MKKQLLGITSIIFVTTFASAFAAEMMVDTAVKTDTMNTSVSGGAMMKDDTMHSDKKMMTNTMMKDTSMKSDSMMKTDTMSMKSNLMMNSHGASVTALQAFLEEKGYLHLPQGVAKGHFGKLTKMALMEYQSSVGLPSTGYYGAMTRAKMADSMMMKDDSIGMKKDDGMMGMKDEGVMVGGALMVANKDIVDNAVNANNVTTVVAAVKAAGLVDTLKSKGPFTVFAPNNKAFDALPAGTVATLLLPENKAKLTDILTYHVVAGTYKSKDLYDGQMLTTVEGKTLKITKVNGSIMINGSAMIETPNVISSNGVTHVITSVLLPQ